MFSDSRASGFKSHAAAHFIPWLRNSLKLHHSDDLGISRPFKSSSEARNHLSPRETAKGIGFFSKERTEGKERLRRREHRCNGVSVVRRLPVVLKGHNILPGRPGKLKEKSKSLEPDPDPDTLEGPQGQENSSAPVQDNHSEGSLVRNHSRYLNRHHSQNDEGSVRKCRPLAGPPPGPALPGREQHSEVPVVVCTEDRRGKVWDYARHTYSQRDLHSSSWLSSDTHRQLSDIKLQSRSSQSQRDLMAVTEPCEDGFNSPSIFNGVIFSTEIPQRGPGCAGSLRGPRKARTSPESTSFLVQNQRTEGGCSRKAVQNQIKRVVDNLEQVLGALRDVHQEMKEVVQQIDYLTSSIDLNEEQEGFGGDTVAKAPLVSTSSSVSCSSEVTVGNNHQRSSMPEKLLDSFGSLDRSKSFLRQSPPNVLLCPITAGIDRIRTLRFSCSIGCSPRPGGSLLCLDNVASAESAVNIGGVTQHQSLISKDLLLSPQRSSCQPGRPPTPGLSPRTVNVHQPPSPPLQRHHQPLVFSPSVTIETKIRSYQTTQGDKSSAQPVSPLLIRPLSDSRAPTVSEIQAGRGRQASSAGPAHGPRTRECASPANMPKQLATQGRRGRKPPPYPHHRLSEHTKEVERPCKAPPYPEKRRLLSTIV
ncbi:uncharacterized protein LOC117518630 [Thalassophryne amazonica]|uniref:uncharacterized protein LOC117518630 n=1 Tax=Thalassophryne amazonica TaxID=390379 RepID=UPI001470C55E|nr:uncharacterized protein LOC117518630 [Thalassophryne amazonica]XP_034035721.1 uncharacterized protein LOC117518630 [Thalassophryne amazonica]